MKRVCLGMVLASLLLGHVQGRSAWAENWPQWRGPFNNGLSEEIGIPTEFSPQTNLVWRLALPGQAGATPVVWDDRIFMTSAADSNVVLWCVSTDGKKLWEQQLGTGNQRIRGDEGNLASPSPCTDGASVWALVGNGDLACFAVTGEPEWQFNLADRYGELRIPFGFTSTPVLDGDKLYLQCMHQNAALVFCLDKSTGRELWRRERPSDAFGECLDSYASPILYRDQEREFLLSHGADYIVAHRLNDGSEIWRCGGFNPKNNYEPTLRLVASPAAVPGLIVVPSAKNHAVLGLLPENEGDITNTESGHQWVLKRGTPDVPSPLIHEGLVYLLRENGELVCLDGKSGQEKYAKRCFSDRYRASPVYADGKIYVASRRGVISVIKAGPKFELLAENELGEEISSSLIVANGRLYVRTFESLYAFANP